VRRTLVAISAALALGADVPCVAAQRAVTSLDVSGTSVWYADSIQSAGGSLTPAVRLDWSRATVSAFANVSRLARGGLSAEATLSPSVFTPSAGPLVGELAGSFGGSGHQDGTRTGQMLAVARLHAMGGGGGAWVGGGAGRTWDGSVWRDLRQGEAGAWIERDDATALATVTPVVVADTIRYTDVQAALRYPAASLDLGLSAGARAGSVGPAVGGTSRAWGNVSVVAWLQPRLALVATAGTYPVDLTQGYPGGRFVTLAVRIASREPRRAARDAATGSSPRADAASETRGAGATLFQVRTAQGTQRTLRVYAPQARTVEINGDFTLWQPVALARGNDGWWTTVQPIAAGTHQVNLRVDGGKWLAPPGLLTASDEFGGVVGILTIE